MRTCTIPGCHRPYLARGWCKNHYEHNRTYGTPHRSPEQSIEARLRARIRESEIIFEGKPCWEWTGVRTPRGYGQMSVDNQHQYTHRLAYETWVGPIPDGLHIDHLCGNTACCNPAHLEPVPPAVNTRRHFAQQTHCRAGHLFDERNTRLDKYGRRNCRACDRERARIRREERKNAA